MKNNYQSDIIYIVCDEALFETRPVAATKEGMCL